MAKEPFDLLEGAMLEGTGNTYVATHACAHPPPTPTHVRTHTHTCTCTHIMLWLLRVCHLLRRQNPST